jgi:hypothetical protein
MTADRIKEIQNETAVPDSVSVCQALMKVWNECEQERMYSEEELKNAIEISVAKALGVMNFTINEESFKQFKKK